VTLRRDEERLKVAPIPGNGNSQAVHRPFIWIDSSDLLPPIAGKSEGTLEAMAG
jgi:hypothetical protein